MAELRDYSGEFNRNLRMEDFSKDKLVKLWEAGGRFYVGVDGIWSTLVKEKFGEQIAKELDEKVWEIATLIDVRKVCEIMNITEHDVAAVFKFTQVDPGSAPMAELEFELKNKNHGILHVVTCRSLDYFERRGETALMKQAYEVACPKWFEVVAHYFNPNIKVTPLKLPPRESKDEIACQWEFKLEE